jgi:hypothetical protein
MVEIVIDPEKRDGSRHGSRHLSSVMDLRDTGGVAKVSSTQLRSVVVPGKLSGICWLVDVGVLT